MLSQTLRDLERDGPVTRKAFATAPVTVEHSVTPLGKTLAGQMKELVHRAEENIGQVPDTQRRQDEGQASTL